MTDGLHIFRRPPFLKRRVVTGASRGRFPPVARVVKVIEHWETGFGSTYNLTRKEALARVAIETDLDGVLVAIERETGQRPTIIATSARAHPGTTRFAELRHRLAAANGPALLLFGTGWGLSPELLQRADLRLEPVCGPSPYNHLSVRAAAAIILDRLYGAR